MNKLILIGSAIAITLGLTVYYNSTLEVVGGTKDIAPTIVLDKAI